MRPKRNLSSLEDELRQPAETPPREDLHVHGKETGWKTQLTTLEGVPSVSRGWKIVLAPVFFYLMVGTGALFLVYELEKLVYRLGHAVRAPGLSDGSATEWHTKDLRLVIAFPIVVPILAIWNLLLLFWDGVSAAGRGISAVATRIWLSVKAFSTWLAEQLSRAWAWINRWVQRIAAGIAGVIAALWHMVTRPIVAVWRWLIRTASRAWHWFAAGVALVWGSLVAAFTTAGRWLTGVLRTLWNWITRPIVAVWHWLVRAVRAAWRLLAAGVALVWESLVFAFAATRNGSLTPSEHFWGGFFGRSDALSHLIGRVSSAVWIWLAAAISAVWIVITKPLMAIGTVGGSGCWRAVALAGCNAVLRRAVDLFGDHHSLARVIGRAGTILGRAGDSRRTGGTNSG